MGASLLSCHWTLVHLDHRAEERKLRYGRIIRQKQIENEKKKISFPPHGESQSAKTCFLGMVKNMLKFEISNGHNWGAIWSYRAVSTTVGTART